MREVYDAFERERLAREPKCDASGSCCRFEAYGHRLFVSTLELASFVANSPPTPADAWDGTGCAYQVDGLCTAREGRPFGCRVYFCDPTSTTWQQEQYERFHARIRELHERFGVPYWYTEWRDGLGIVGLPAAASPVGKSRRLLTVLPAGR